MQDDLKKDGIDMKKHSGTISEFRRRYIVTKTEVEEQIVDAEASLEAVSKYLFC